MMQFQQETVYEVMLDADGLMEQHYQELAAHRGHGGFAVDWRAYAALESAGLLVAVTARDEGKLVGYCGFVLAPNLHFAGVRVAQNTTLFLQKEHRQGMAGVRFLKYAERAARGRGANKVLWHVTPENDFSPILARLGYADEGKLMGKLF